MIFKTSLLNSPYQSVEFKGCQILHYVNFDILLYLIGDDIACNCEFKKNYAYEFAIKTNIESYIFTFECRANSEEIEIINSEITSDINEEYNYQVLPPSFFEKNILDYVFFNKVN